MSLPEILRRRRWHRYETDAARHWEVVWEDHWRGKSYAALLEEARSSEQARFLRERLPAAGLVVESGCGHGQWLAVLAQDGRRLVGLDRFERPMRAALAANPRLVFVCGDVLRSPFRDGCAAAVTSFGVVEHFEEGCGAALADMQRILRSDGVLLISVPYYSLVRRIAEPFRLARERLRESPCLRRALGRAPLPPRRFYQYAYTTAEFARVLSAAGFRSLGAIHYDTEFGLVRDSPLLRALRRRLPRVFRFLHRSLRAVSTKVTAHMQMHRAVIDGASGKSG